MALAGVWSPSAGASVGTGVGADSLVLAQPAHPGATYRLPDLVVVNTGTDVARYTLRISREPKRRHRTVPPGWVHFSPTTFRLEPEARRTVPIELSVPGSVPDGSYAAYVTATALSPNASGASAGAAAATVLTFSVKASPPDGLPWLRWFGTGSLVLAVLAVLAYIVRRSGIRVTVERRPSPPTAS